MVWDKILGRPDDKPKETPPVPVVAVVVETPPVPPVVPVVVETPPAA